MGRGSVIQPRRLARNLAVATALLWLPGSATAGKPLDATVELGLEFGPQFGSRELQRQLELALLDDLRQDGCFSRIVSSSEIEGDVATDLSLVVRIDDFRDEQSFDMSIGAMSSPNAGPNPERQVTATTEILFTATLSAPTPIGEIKSRTMRVRSSYRPVLDEDPRAEARSRALRDVGSTVRRYACKGSSKLGKRLRGQR